MVSKLDKYWCESCVKLKIGTCVALDPKSVDTNEYYKCYSTDKKDSYLKHLASVKHNENKHEEIKEEHSVVCPHCNTKMYKEIWLQHKKRNELLWLCKSMGSEWTKYSSCNNFITDTGKRFNNVKSLKDCMENKSKYGRTKKTIKDAYNERAIDSGNKTKEQVLIENKENNVKEEKKEFTCASEFVFEEYCPFCGFGSNYEDYDEERMKLLGVKYCVCGESTEED